MRFPKTLGAAVMLLLVTVQARATTAVAAGNARFEVLTPSLVRMEYSPSGKLIDAPTAVVQKRDWPAVPVMTRRSGGWLVLTTSAMRLRYRLDSGAFTAANLSVSWRDPAGGLHAWVPGQADPGNLGGLTYSLDNIESASLPPPGNDLGSPVHDVIPGIDVLLEPATPGLLLVAPVLQAGGARTVYLPPGAWLDFFTGKRYRGDTTFTARYPVDATPVFVRAGAVIPEEAPAADPAGAGRDELTVNVYGEGTGRFDLYEDDGTSLDYQRGSYALTPMMYHTAGSRHTLVIGPTHGSFAAEAERRAYRVSVHAARRPAPASVDGKRLAGWRWDAHDSTAYLTLPVASIRHPLTITW